MSEPVTPISGAYPPPAIIVRNDGATARTRPEALAPVAAPATASVRMVSGQAVALAGSGWVPVLHTSQRRGLRADETERRRYRASYASAADAPARPAPRMEQRA
ncbi:hypothetical protein [Glycocaulis sp.]|uniref:hypothetical protein n=1 Tax=Glycocaulis sp. TaxID=1969725 RepID=UPI003D1E02ED